MGVHRRTWNASSDVSIEEPPGSPGDMWTMSVLLFTVPGGEGLQKRVAGAWGAPLPRSAALTGSAGRCEQPTGSSRTRGVLETFKPKSSCVLVITLVKKRIVQIII